MTMAEFLSLAEEYNLPVENPERFRFMIREMSAAEFRAWLDKEEDAPTWTDDGAGRVHDGRGNSWTQANAWDGWDPQDKD